MSFNKQIFKTRSYVTNLGLTVTIENDSIKGFYFKPNPLLKKNMYVSMYFDGNKTMVLYFTEHKEKDSMRIYAGNNLYFITGNSSDDGYNTPKKNIFKTLNESFSKKIESKSTSIPFRYTSIINNMAILTTEQSTYNIVVESNSRIATSRKTYDNLFQVDDDTR
ncbi:MAG TPA: hypothetical protein PKD00_01525 [Burkholderiales bacterium]|nr:hypothetical protein [Burkholderiales bacterium]